MIYSRFILLCFIHEIGSFEVAKIPSLVYDARAELEAENFLRDFMIDLKISGFEKAEYHWLAFMGIDENFLRASKVVLESGGPYLVITKTELRTDLSRIGPDGIVLFFVDGLSDFQIILGVSALPTKFNCRLLMISMQVNTTDLTISETLKSATKLKITNVSFAKFDGRGMRIYRSVLGMNCGEEVTLVDTWLPRKGFANNRAILRHLPHPNGHGCPMIISTFESLPRMILGKNANGTLQIRGGLEGHLVNAIAEHLHFVPVLKRPSVDEHFWTFPNGTTAGIVADVANQLAAFGIGQIRPTVERLDLVDFTKSYCLECMVWTVPLKVQLNQNIITSEFSPITWIIVALSVTLCCGLTHVAAKFHGVTPTSGLDVLNVIAVTLNYAIPRQPARPANKLLFLVYLHYSRILSTAYSASLASMLTAPEVEPTIQDEEGIISAGFRTAGSEGSRELLSDQISQNSTRIELIKRFQVISSPDEALRRIGDRQDIAYLRHLSTIGYIMQKRLIAGKRIDFNIIDRCVISYNSVVVLRKGSRLILEINDFILRIQEAGLENFWRQADRYTSKFHLLPLEYKNHALFRLKSIFLFYLYCLIPTFLVFGAELLVFKLKSNRYISRCNN